MQAIRKAINLHNKLVFCYLPEYCSTCPGCPFPDSPFPDIPFPDSPFKRRNPYSPIPMRFLPYHQYPDLNEYTFKNNGKICFDDKC